MTRGFRRAAVLGFVIALAGGFLPVVPLVLGYHMWVPPGIALAFNAALAARVANRIICRIRWIWLVLAIIAAATWGGWLVLGALPVLSWSLEADEVVRKLIDPSSARKFTFIRQPGCVTFFCTAILDGTIMGAVLALRYNPKLWMKR